MIQVILGIQIVYIILCEFLFGVQLKPKLNLGNGWDDGEGIRRRNKIV